MRSEPVAGELDEVGELGAPHGPCCRQTSLPQPADTVAQVGGGEQGSCPAARVELVGHAGDARLPRRRAFGLHQVFVGRPGCLLVWRSLGGALGHALLEDWLSRRISASTAFCFEMSCRYHESRRSRRRA